jgi:hypothetical protein
MHHLIALLAGCLLHPPADDPCKEAREAQYEFLRTHDVQVIEWNANGTVKQMKATHIYVRSGFARLEQDQPAPPELLEAIGPALLARGTEELRIRMMSRGPTPGELTVKLDEYIAGRKVKWSYVNIVLRESTNQVTEVYAGFMPDRGLDHEPRLSQDEAKAKAAITLPEYLQRQRGEPAAKFSFYDGPADLAYEFEKVGADAILGGALVWMISVNVESQSWSEVSVDAATGKVVRMYDAHF